MIGDGLHGVGALKDMYRQGVCALRYKPKKPTLGRLSFHLPIPDRARPLCEGGFRVLVFVGDVCLGGTRSGVSALAGALAVSCAADRAAEVYSLMVFDPIIPSYMYMP